MSEAPTGLPSIEGVQRRRAMPVKDTVDFNSRDFINGKMSPKTVEFTPGKIRMASNKAQSTNLLNRGRNSPDWIGSVGGMLSGVITKYKKPKY